MEFCFLGGILLEPPSKDCFGDAAFTGGGFETFTPTSSSPWNLSLRTLERRHAHPREQRRRPRF